MVGSIPASAGEPRHRAFSFRDTKGLSPRARGNPWRPSRRSDVPGSIPASAGEPTCISTARTTDWVYPRERGGTATETISVTLRSGLSPRARGNQPADRRHRSALRSIPASAGEPRGTKCHQPLHRVYPRERGGTVSSWALSAFIWGLSPRARGNPCGRAGQGELFGSIPASAGEPAIDRVLADLDRVYPRERGGTQPDQQHVRLGQGLSPRARGNRP